MELLWSRGQKPPSFTRPTTHFAMGVRGSGKSSLLEYLGMKYLENGCTVLDLHGSADGENLAWLRSPYTEDRRILLLKGENVDVDSEYDVKLYSGMTLSDLESYDIIISARPLYLNRDQYFYAIGELTELLYQRLSWNKLVYLLSREASSLWYSRVRVSEQQTDTKAEAIYLLREARHMGLALGLDSLRFKAIDVDIRSMVDNLWIKSQGVDGLSNDLRWLYSFYRPLWIRKMKPEEFALVCKTGEVGIGTFPFHEWHKREREDILRSVGIDVEKGEMPDLGIDRGGYRTVSSKEHADIIRLYRERGLGMNKISKRIGRSTKTVSDHIHQHNDALKRSGFCPSCKKVGSDFEQKEAVRV